MNIKDYKNYILRNHYDKYTGLVDQIRTHIHNIAKNNNISLNDKNVYLNELFEILKYLNLLYNNAVIMNDTCDSLEEPIKSLYESRKFDILYNHISKLRILNEYKKILICSKEIHTPLIDINDRIKILVSNIGMNNIKMIIDLYINKNFNKETTKIIEFI
jgi:hypothetical protein